jgi:hypothetical protein
MSIQGGPGPWFVFLLVNRQTKYSEVVAHSYPHLMVEVLNFSKKQAQWFCQIMIGPFESWLLCLHIIRQWTDCKQLKTRIEQAKKIFKEHSKMQQDIYFWYTNDGGPSLTVHEQRDPNITVKDIKNIEKRRVL